MSESGSKALFTLSVASEIIGVHPRTLMLYEKAGLVTPARTKTNRRRFSHGDIKRLQFIRYLTSGKGLNLAGVRFIFSLLEKENKKGLDLKKEVFADFSEKDIF